MNDKYYDWLCQFVYDETNSFHNSYKRLLKDLYSREFYWKMVMDENRAKDGVALRDRYEFDTHIPSGKEGSCSVLEMMIALAIRCEEHIMGDPDIGDRTGQWFWAMIVNMGLGPYTDSRFDEKAVDSVVTSMLDRKYKSNGEGGLFIVDNCGYDLRRVEIWYQLCWYLGQFN